MCAICSDTAEGVPTPSDGVAFSCGTHGDFSIARTAMPRFSILNQDGKVMALDRAKIFAPQRHGEVVLTSMDL